MGQKVLTGAAVRRSERGVTLIEVIVAMTILTGVLLSLAVFAADFTKAVSQADSRTVAVNLAEQRIAEIRASPNYSGLEANYNGTEATIDGFPGYSRVTTITHTGGARPTYTNDYKTVTVTVSGPTLSAPIKKTIIVAAP